eukprot:CAMPEP_0115220586 /NCGR_PEP_ID=MMETSP0270-20121206/27521_1 /TAXON_ID=71861 /ORGANISM="Scrippsiella trochoidea, Strain CCMP3099" /LENGTH=41 /DNA_ID= /DNA_START= /DNA_END= /DNA_ORIENTATION=
MGALRRKRCPPVHVLATGREAGDDKSPETWIAGLNPLDHAV